MKDHEKGKMGQRLWAEFRRGGPEAFLKIYQRFQRPIVHYVKSMVRDHAVAEELVQEIFIKVFRFREQYQLGFAFSTWLWTIARNTVRDYHRGMKLYVAGEVLPDGTLLSPEQLPSPEPSVETQMISKDLRRTLFSAARRLTKVQRRVLWLRVIKQLSYAEIAQSLGLSLASVKNQVHRSKSALNEGGFALSLNGVR